MQDRLRAVQCPFDIINQIVGWSAAGLGNVYGSGYGLDVSYEGIEKVEVRKKLCVGSGLKFISCKK